MNQQLQTNQTTSPFDRIRQWKDGFEFWSARDLQELMDYTEWRNFEEAIERAKIACKNSGLEPHRHFVDVNKIVKAGATTKPIQDYHLTRYACYLVAMNSDPHKIEVSRAQTYFAQKTHEAETASQPAPALPESASLWEQLLQLSPEELTHTRQAITHIEQAYHLLIPKKILQPFPKHLPPINQSTLRSDEVMLQLLQGKSLTYMKWVRAGINAGLSETSAKKAIRILVVITHQVQHNGKLYFSQE